MAFGRWNGSRLQANISPAVSFRSLLAGHDGTLWIGTNKGLATWKGNRLTHYAALAGHDVLSLYEDRKGTVWAGLLGPPSGMLCAIRSGGSECYGEDGRFGPIPGVVYEDRRGNLWDGKPASGDGTPARLDSIQ